MLLSYVLCLSCKWSPLFSECWMAGLSKCCIASSVPDHVRITHVTKHPQFDHGPRFNQYFCFECFQVMLNNQKMDKFFFFATGLHRLCTKKHQNNEVFCDAVPSEIHQNGQLFCRFLPPSGGFGFRRPRWRLGWFWDWIDPGELWEKTWKNWWQTPSKCFTKRFVWSFIWYLMHSPSWSFRFIFQTASNDIEKHPKPPLILISPKKNTNTSSS